MGSSASKVPPNWDASQMPSLDGKVAVVTGANSGIGLETSFQLARKGATVILGCRSEERGKEAEKLLQEKLSKEEGQTGTVSYMKLDLCDLSSVRTFSQDLHTKHDKINYLINNAGVMAIAHSETVDKLDKQWSTNHFGPFALTSQIFDLLVKGAPSRIVNVSSIGARLSYFNEDNIVASPDKYTPNGAYADTKLSNQLFANELDRRLKAQGITDVVACAANPGIVATNLFTAPTIENDFFMRAFWKVGNLFLYHQSPEMGALPTLFAATGENVEGGELFAPDRFSGCFGYPTQEDPPEKAKSTSAAEKLWKFSEEQTKVPFNVSK